MVLLVVLGMVTGCTTRETVDPASEKPTAQNGSATADSQENAKEVKVDGSVVTLPSLTADICAFVSGQLTSVNLTPGERVAQGQILATIDDRPFRARLRAAETGLRLAISSLEAAKDAVVESNQKLTAAGANLEKHQKMAGAERATKEVLLAKNQVASAMARLRSAESNMNAARSKLVLMRRLRQKLELDLSLTSVRSIIDGVVEERLLKAGDNVTPKTPIGKVVWLKSVHINTAVPADSVSELRVGHRASVKSVGTGDTVFDASVTKIGHVVDPGTKTVRVQLLCPRPDGKLQDKQKVSITFIFKPDS